MPVSRWGRPRSLQARQLLAASLGLVAFLALAGFALDRAFLSTAESNLQQRLKSYALAYADDIEFLRDGSLYVPDTPPDPRFSQPGGGLYAEVVLPNGHWDSPSAQGPRLPPGMMLAPGDEAFTGPLPITELGGDPGQAYRYGMGLVWSMADDPDAEFPYTIHILEDTTTLSRQIGVFRQALWGYLGSAGLILLLLQMAVLRWSLMPLRRVVAELKRVQRGVQSRMSARHPRELEPLTESINAFIETERQNLDRHRHVLADLAHSLKTPLAVLRSRLDSDAGEVELREELDTQVRRMNDIVSYQLARAASGGHALFAPPVAIEPHAEEIVRGLEKVYAGKGVLCEFEIEPEARFPRRGRGPAGTARQPARERIQVGTHAGDAERARGRKRPRAPPGPVAGGRRRRARDRPRPGGPRVAARGAWRRAGAGPWHRPGDRAGHRAQLPRHPGSAPRA
jgi:two-component system, OmpR family, sensor histidine kinase PhoQ